MLVSKPFAQLSGASIGRRERRAVTLHGFAVRKDGSAAAVRLTDVSNDGCGLETTAELEQNEHIELSVSGHGAIAASVRWCANGRAGVVFDAVPAVQRRLSRGSARHSLATEVTLRRTGRAICRVRVLDVSSTGCRLEVVDRPNVDERVWLRFDGLESIEATVCWVAGFKVGLKYANPIHPAVFGELLRRFDASQGDR